MLTVNLTTTHSRLDLCASTLWSILRQSCRPDLINLWISSEKYLSDNGINKLPDFINQLNNIHDIIKVHYVKNTGPYRKLIPVLRTSCDEDLIIYADDDVVYGKDWIKKLLDCFNKHHQSCIVASRIRVVTYNLFGQKKSYFSYPIAYSERVFDKDYIITGMGGCILKKGMIINDYIYDDSYLDIAPKTDDLWFSRIFQNSGVKAVSCPQSLEQIYEIQHELSSLSYMNTLYYKKYGMFNIFHKIKNKFLSYFGLLGTNNDIAFKKVSDYFNKRP